MRATVARVMSTYTELTDKYNMPSDDGSADESESSTWFGASAKRRPVSRHNIGSYGTVEKPEQPELRWNLRGFTYLPVWFLVVLCTYAYYVGHRPTPSTRAPTSAPAPAPARTLLVRYCDGLGDVYAAACRARDAERFCAPSGPGRDDPSAAALRAVVDPLVGADGACADACDGGGVPACLWAAVAALPAFCDGSFAFAAPARRDLDDGAAADATPYNLDCDRAAICAACGPGTAFPWTANDTCEQVARHYGAPDRPLFGAVAAARALTVDRARWCDAAP